MRRYPYDEKRYAKGLETFQTLLGIAEGHLTSAGTPFLVGKSITLAVSEWQWQGGSRLHTQHGNTNMSTASTVTPQPQQRRFI
jgi:hypothetical protein